jgi:hypothetical protein
MTEQQEEQDGVWEKADPTHGSELGVTLSPTGHLAMCGIWWSLLGYSTGI